MARFILSCNKALEELISPCNRLLGLSCPRQFAWQFELTLEKWQDVGHLIFITVKGGDKQIYTVILTVADQPFTKL